jgi:crotonobetainyl-CoA:carnitine CoA-transferase CaiB-like acyl-CoA transferase
LSEHVTRKSALSDIRVLDIATFVAAPFCGTILADFGADVIKIEEPNGGDSLRRFGTMTDCGDSLVWLSESRNKSTITLDLRQPLGQELFRKLVSTADVVLENFRPGTLEKWGLGYESLREVNPRLVMLRISAYGQNGPKSSEPGFARIAHAFSGLSFLSGEKDGPPVVPGSTSMADYASGMWGAIGVLIALHHRDRTGEGQSIDIGLYESVFRLLDEIAPAFAKYGIVRERMGADTINVVPHSHYQTATGEWVALACTNDRMWCRFAQMIGRANLAKTFPASEDRVAHRDEINAIVSTWIGARPLAELLELTLSHGVPCAQIYSIEDIFNDPQYKARGNLLTVEDPRAGELTLPAPMPKMSKTPPSFRHAGKALGDDNNAIYRDLLGLSDAQISELATAKVI